MFVFYSVGGTAHSPTVNVTSTITSSSNYPFIIRQQRSTHINENTLMNHQSRGRNSSYTKQRIWLSISERAKESVTNRWQSINQLII